MITMYDIVQLLLYPTVERLTDVSVPHSGMTYSCECTLQWHDIQLLVYPTVA